MLAYADAVADAARRVWLSGQDPNDDDQPLYCRAAFLFFFPPPPLSLVTFIIGRQIADGDLPRHAMRSDILLAIAGRIFLYTSTTSTYIGTGTCN